jgi:hypothetical protein
VRIAAVYPDGDDEVLNAQLMFYAAAARHAHPEFFYGVTNIILTILQPQSADPHAEMVSSAEVSHDELDQFVVAFRAACTEALSPSPRLAKGAWCRFCAAKTVCPLYTAPLLDLARFEAPAPWSAAHTLFASGHKAAYLQVLATGLALVDAVKDLGVALRDQAKAALERGDSIAGYCLSQGRNERHWISENTALGTLLCLGLTRDDILVEKMCSPKQVEVKAKARGLRVPSELIGSRRSGASLMRSENARSPVPSRDEIVRSFSTALKGGNNGR